MTAGDTTMTECAQLPLDHSPSIKTELNVAMMFWQLSVISGSTSYLSRKGVFVVGLTLPLSDLTDIVETMPRCRSILSSAMRKAAWVSAMNKQLSKKHVKQRFSAWYFWNEEDTHTSRVNTALPLSSFFFLSEKIEIKDNVLCYISFPTKHYTKFWIKVRGWKYLSKTILW